MLLMHSQAGIFVPIAGKKTLLPDAVHAWPDGIARPGQSPMQPHGHNDGDEKRDSLTVIRLIFLSSTSLPFYFLALEVEGQTLLLVFHDRQKASQSIGR